MSLLLIVLIVLFFLFLVGGFVLSPIIWVFIAVVLVFAFCSRARL